MCDILIIYQRKDQDVDSEHTFCIESELESLDQQEKENIFSEYESLNLSERYGIDRYQIISQYFALSRYDSLQQAIFIHERLTNKIEKQNIDEIVVKEDVQVKYQKAIEDAVGNDITIEVMEEQNSFSLTKFLKLMVRLCYILFEHFIHAIFWRTENHAKNVIFVLNPHRKKSTLPVIQNAEEKELNHLVLSQRPKIKTSSNTRKMADSNLVNYITLKIWWEELNFFVNLLFEVFISKDFPKEISREMQSKIGVNLDNTIECATKNIFLSNTAEQYSYAFLARATFQTIDCDKIVVNTMSPSGRSILLEAEKEGIEPYHIPHTVIPPTHNSVGKTKHFVCGELDMKYLRDLPQISNMSKYIPSGRPYLYELYNNWESVENETEGLLITVATQPVSDKHELICEIINVAEEIEKHIEIEIKIHPGERVKEYKQYTDRNGGKVTVVDDELFRRISRADLVLTRNSNVGLEAMIVGTPCVAVNWWRPFQNDMSYILYGPVPVCKKKENIHELFSSLDQTYLTDLEQNQTEFIEQNIQISDNPSDRIVEYLRS